MTATTEFPEHTITEVLDQLAGRGYAGSFHIDDRTSPGGLWCGACRHRLRPEPIRVAETWRFEGPSDPADEALLLAFTCPHCRTGGVLVCAYGPGTSDGETEVIAALDRPPTGDGARSSSRR